jgi:hypothetical protein
VQVHALEALTHRLSLDPQMNHVGQRRVNEESAS